MLIRQIEFTYTSLSPHFHIYLTSPHLTSENISLPARMLGMAQLGRVR
jgi:hypothetical protein